MLPRAWEGWGRAENWPCRGGVSIEYTRAGRYAAGHRCCVAGSGSVLMTRLPVGSSIY